MSESAMEFGAPWVPDHVWKKLQITEGGCWVSPFGLNEKGYAKVKFSKKRTGPASRSQYLHRVMFQAQKGPLPPGLQVDHLCRVRNCVNPAHLEAVTVQENRNRGQVGEVLRRRWAALRERTHCNRGHEYTEENSVFRHNRNSRSCKTCRNLAEAARREVRKNLRGETRQTTKTDRALMSLRHALDELRGAYILPGCSAQIEELLNEIRKAGHRS